MDFQTEAEIEQRLIEVLGEGHNQWTYRPDLKSEEDLWQNLRTKLTQNNLSELQDTPITDKEFDLIKTKLLSETQTPFDAARWLRGENGIAYLSFEREDTSLGRASLVVYSNQDIGGGISSYEVVNQIAKKSDSVNSRDRRFDVTLLINGLPIVQIELKQVRAKDGIYQAFNQVKKYAEEGVFRNNLFSTLQLFVVSNEQTTRYFANSLPKDMHRKFLFSWRTTDNKKVDGLYEVCKQVLNIPDAHRLLAHYTILSEDQDNKQLMVLHPYQIHAIEAIFTATNKHKSGYIWHATGSGKTLTSFVATKLLAKKSGVDRTIMLVDRRDLDDQTTKEFTKFASEFNTGSSADENSANTLIVGTGSTKALSEALVSENNSNVIIVTTRQKLDQALKYARKQEEQKGTNRFSRLVGQHIVFIVDECHRALSAENMIEIQEFFPNSTWFGFTGTPIFEENKKQAQGQLARTTYDQYGDRLHTYTIKNALEDGAVLGFQVEHETTIESTSQYNHIYHCLKQEAKYRNKSDDELNTLIDEMEPTKKETYLDKAIYQTDEHIQEVLKKILRPDNAYIKFDFKAGRPTKSAILTTSSIEMAKRYYQAIKKIKASANWREELFPNHPIRQGRTMEDPDFPRVAITYSLEENKIQANSDQREMAEIIHEYNEYYHTTWSLSDIEFYNKDINNRLKRKQAEFKQFGNQVDLVIVVDRLLTGFDAPTIQTLFVDRNLEYAGLIQAFSRTNRTYPEKNKGLIVTFRKPHTMEANVKEATRLYSNATEETGLIYPTYEESFKKFETAFQRLEKFVIVPGKVDEQTDLETRIEYIKAFQAVQNAYDSLVTYDEYNDDIEHSPALQEQITKIAENVGFYETVKGSIIDDPSLPADISEIEFFSHSAAKLYDIDSAYIDQLLENYSADNSDVRAELEKALTKLNKSEAVKEVYRLILHTVDTQKDAAKEDIFSLKRRFFTKEKNRVIEDFANEWFVSSDELHSSAIQYMVGMDPIPNIGNVIESKNYEAFKVFHPEIKPFSYPQKMKRDWRKILDDNIIPLEDELR